MGKKDLSTFTLILYKGSHRMLRGFLTKLKIFLTGLLQGETGWIKGSEYILLEILN